MSKNRKWNSWNNTLGPILVVLAGLAFLTTILLRGNNVALFNSKGMIAHEQHSLTMLVVGVMLIVAIPAVFLFYFTAWKYRESNSKARRDPDVGHGKLLNVSMWVVPFIFMIVLSAIMWPATHRLAPQKQIAADAKPLTIQVIALRWKWLFIYPEQRIATVNFVQVPTHTPVIFELTADEAPMSSFWIPNLGGMLYAMTGHVNRLNLVADTSGDYPGSSAEINGSGFAGMKFIASATSKEDFDLWVRDVSMRSGVLSSTEYDKLLKPSENNPESFYSLSDSDLYATVLMKYPMAHTGDHIQHEGH
jgi:cytochrome o ubiquinol oxidase subunit 2